MPGANVMITRRVRLSTCLYGARRRPQNADAACIGPASRRTVVCMPDSEDVVRRDDLLAAGCAGGAISRRLARGAWQAPFRGVLIRGPASVDLPTLAAAAVGTQRPARALASHGTAAALWNLDGAAMPLDSCIHLTVPREATTRHRPGLRLHRALLDDADRAQVDGVAVTSAARTVVDLARTTSRWAAVLAADSAMRQRLCTPAELHRVVDRLAGMRGVVSARRVVEDSEPRSRSAGESRLRLTLVDGGLPRPHASHLLIDDFGEPLAEGDLVYDDLLVWLEYDGFAVHTQRAIFRADRGRERMLRARGWEVLRFVDSDVAAGRRLVAEVGSVLADAPRRIAALPADRSPEVARARRLLGF